MSNRGEVAIVGQWFFGTLRGKRERRTRMVNIMAKGALVLGLVLGVIGLAACQQETAKVTTTTAKSEPQYGGTYRLAITTGPRSLDLQQETWGQVLYTVGPGVDGIIQFDAADAKDSKIIPDLAERWELGPDGKTYTFYFTKNAKWSDGVPFTAKDAKFTMDRIMNPPKGVVSQRGAWFKNVEAVELVDDYTLRFRLKQPQPAILQMLAIGWTAMAPQHVFEKEGQDALKRNVVGTGPFKMTAYDEGVSARLERRTDYFVKGVPYLDAIEFYYFADAVATYAAFKSGQADEGPVPVAEEKSFVKERPRYAYQKANGTHNLLIRFDATRPPFNDARVRKALSLVTDRDAENQAAYEGKATIGGPMPAGGNFAIPEEEIRKMPGFRKDKTEDIAEAKRLMTEAGYPNGFKVPFLFHTIEEYNQAGMVVIDQWRKALNVEIEGEKFDNATMLSKYDKKDFIVGVYGVGNQFDDPDDVMAVQYTTSGTRNYGKYSNLKVDQLIAEQSVTTDLDKRKKLVRQAQDIVLDEVPQLLLHWTPRDAYVPPWVKDFVLHNGIYTNPRKAYIWLDQKDPDYRR